jgi:hypothetical protein
MASLAMHLLEIKKDLPAAVGVYEKVAGHPSAPSFYRRKLAFLMVEDPGKTVRGYRMLKELALSDPAALRREDMTRIGQLESRLGIPEAKRINP